MFRFFPVPIRGSRPAEMLLPQIDLINGPGQRTGLLPPSVETIGIWLLAALTMISTLIVITNTYTPLPLFDQWAYWRSGPDYQNHFWREVFRQHSEHRIAIPRLLFLIDHHVFRGTNVFLLASSFALQLGTSALFLFLAVRRSALSLVSRWNLGGALLACLFTAQQFTNFTWGFQVQFIMVYFATFAALTLLYIGAERSRLWLIPVIASGFVASFSMANGLLVWPWLIVLAFALGIPSRR